MIINVGIKNKNDEIFDIIDNLIIVRKENGDYEIIKIYIDEEKAYRISDKTIQIVYGKSKNNETDLQILFLKKSDKVLKILYNNIYIKKKNGDIEVYSINEKDNDIFLGSDILKITNGNKIINISDENEGMQVITF
ncbi:hypothetical protein [Brachyspira hampsonii]|uniref:hypothetical protein n=1 Tax=Brachyspira hampsonii TaxID=1287055 RepID=UPI000D356362|nr:hypothetical protein [Brachyspira hampsonii]PTY41211.1 hypothetical protein DQ06_12035 [Brachyspira hampsonii bv. II]